MPTQLGVPLDKERLVNMSKEEEAFWNEFLDKIQVIVNNLTEDEWGRARLPQDLIEKYNTAIKRYNGSQYCQMRQIARIFNI